eukprot:snap_masked-scaffold_6-processed-gene-17.7-mRNA-1 protein AED:1.00 eAED:1.00 QI:0/-1/0/0/-1/1/1/0/191
MKYMRAVFDTLELDKEAVLDKITRAKSNFNQFSYLLKLIILNRKTRRRIVLSLALLPLLYDCLNWKITATIKKRLNELSKNMEKKIESLESMNFNLQGGDINICKPVGQIIQVFSEQETVDTQLDAARETTVLEPGTPQYLSEGIYLEQVPQKIRSKNIWSNMTSRCLLFMNLQIQHQLHKILNIAKKTPL